MQRTQTDAGFFMRRMLTVLVMLCITLPVVAAKKDMPLLKRGEPYYRYAPGEVLVQFQPLLSGAGAAEACAALGTQVVEYQADLDFYRVALPAGKTETEAVMDFRARPDVAWANFNYIAEAFYHPNDDFYEHQWHFTRMNMEAAWDVTRGSPSVVVAVCDMGFYFNHADWGGVQRVDERDLVNSDNDASTTVFDSHGAHVAGTIFAATNNSTGVAGLAPLCRLMPVRCLNDSGEGTLAQIAGAVSWATNHSADVINLSLGFPVDGPPQDPGAPLSTAINYANNQGVIICAATGNDGANYVAYPAAYQACIAVGATGYDDAIAPYSNRGAAIDIVAPGGNTAQDLNDDSYVDGVLSTLRNGGGDYYGFWQGTSMATPHAAGIAALLLSNGLAAGQVRQALQETADDLGTNGWDATYGHGRIDAQAALAWGSGGGETTLLQHGFEGSFPPAGWELAETGAPNPDAWEPLAGNSDADGGSGTHGGTNAAFHDDDDTVGDQEDWLITPQITIPATATSAQLRFWQRNYYLPDYYTGNTYHGVLYSTDGTNFSELIELDEAQQTWAEITIGLNSFAGQSIYIAFYYVGDYATEWFIDDVLVTAVVSGAAEDEAAALPREIRLGEAYPNPFNSTAVIPLELPQNAQVELAIYNTLGQRVTTLVEPTLLSAGSHRFTWDADGFATGLYLVRLTSGEAVQTKKLLLVK